jgi:putative transposase
MGDIFALQSRPVTPSIRPSEKAEPVLVTDNSAMESFFSSLKTERTSRTQYRSRNQCRADLFDYVERFYNVRRRHSTIGYVSPAEFELLATKA